MDIDAITPTTFEEFVFPQNVYIIDDHHQKRLYEIGCSSLQTETILKSLDKETFISQKTEDFGKQQRSWQ